MGKAENDMSQCDETVCPKCRNCPNHSIIFNLSRQNIPWHYARYLQTTPTTPATPGRGLALVLSVFTLARRERGGFAVQTIYYIRRAPAALAIAIGQTLKK